MTAGGGAGHDGFQAWRLDGRASGRQSLTGSGRAMHRRTASSVASWPARPKHIMINIKRHNTVSKRGALLEGEHGEQHAEQHGEPSGGGPPLARRAAPHARTDAATPATPRAAAATATPQWAVMKGLDDDAFPLARCGGSARHTQQCEARPALPKAG